MKAMILAAGVGSRLRPLTDSRPKALVEVAGRTLLEIALVRLRACGVREVIINVHHFPHRIAAYLAKNDNFGMRIALSREEALLDTGGGLKKAAWFFLENSSRAQEPFLLHNVDVISGIDLGRMLQFHSAHQALVTLAVQERETSRYLLFNERSELCGRRAREEQKGERAHGAKSAEELAFCGIHVISARLFALMTEEGAFPIIPAYLRLAAQGERVLAFRADEYYWRDLGRPESLALAEHDLRQGLFRP
jgi:NDP-sugar pyrophosphorylase family protein